MRLLKKAFGILVFLLIIYSLGIIAGLWLSWLRFRGRISVRGAPARYPGRGTLILPNHPSYLEAVLLPLLSFPGSLLNPFRRVPWSVPDFKNFLTLPHLFWLRYLHMIPVYRGDMRDARRNARALREIIAVLKSGGTVVMFAEGGRTTSSPAGAANAPQLRQSPALGRKLRPLEPTVATIIERSACIVVPVWIEGTDAVLRRGEHWPRFRRGRIAIRFGIEREHPVTVRQIEDELLWLADRT
jgi:1-acyl-sn-glycerol-3-phosphate acyltransferase